MIGDHLRQLARRIAAWLRTEVGRRVVWVTDIRRDVFGQQSSVSALVAVLGREHYTERRKSYPIRGWRDLSRVLGQELGSAPDVLTLIGPVVDDRREVTFFELHPGAVDRCGRALWLVPESVPLSLALPAQQVVVVERDGLSYFLASSGISQVAGGTVRTSALFALAAGLDPDQESAVLDRDAVIVRLQQGLRRLDASAWLRFLNPSAGLKLHLAWRPLATLALAALAGYLVLASAYLSVTESLRQRELAGLGPEVESLLRTQHEVAELAAEQRALADVFGGRQPTYGVWRLVARAWQKGARIDGMSLVDGRLNLRGRAPSATDVLAALAAEKGVTNARFGAPVRQAGGSEEFTVTLTLVGSDG